MYAEVIVSRENVSSIPKCLRDFAYSKSRKGEEEMGLPSSQWELRFPSEIYDTIILAAVLYTRENWSLILREE
jgi:hypothetical protein